MSSKNKYIYVYPLVVLISILYIVYGVLQIYNGVIEWWLTYISLKPMQLGFSFNNAYIPNAFPEPFSGMFLIVISAVFLKATYLYYKGYEKHRGFLFIGWLLAMMMLVLNITVIVADILDIYYPLIWGGAIDGGWTLASDSWGIAPHLIIGIIALPIYWSIKDMIKELMPG